MRLASVNQKNVTNCMHTMKKHTQLYIQQLQMRCKIQIYVNKTKETFRQNLKPKPFPMLH